MKPTDTAFYVLFGIFADSISYWDDIPVTLQNVIIHDAVARYRTHTAMWGGTRMFTTNYINEVETLFKDAPDLWEKWGEFLRLLNIGG